MKKIKSGDKVVVIAGSYVKKVSTIEKVIGNKVIVKGVNLKKKAVKKEGFVDKTMPIDISNVMLYSDKLKGPTKVKIEERDGKKVRVCKKSGEIYS
ncbi:50S ribosomal protein L24 [Candidatus Vampirococcus lugosii]|uniref:Large ribosomal subunit protein uL24 n=1 Tax=Candidatus Vampirococcus lugosii TaxID=2789015 RepID=A0ABS5QL17_9BACT|nr:50S ribosomal protein L24 [Candidatus Vampirococcus lugosii]MBS8121895.1 Ribosomal protein L24 [Candidatus Vampirococcus lugosii]